MSSTWKCLMLLSHASLALSAPAPAGIFNLGAGPFRIKPGRIEHCPKELEADIPVEFFVSGVTDKKNHELFYYSGNFTTTFEWSDKLVAELRVASWKSRGGWKDNAHVFRMSGVCTAQKNFVPELNRSLMLGIHGDENAQCPFPPGTYVFRNVSTDFSVKPIPTFIYGKWRLDAKMFHPTTRVSMGCVRIYAETLPKI